MRHFPFLGISILCIFSSAVLLLGILGDQCRLGGDDGVSWPASLQDEPLWQVQPTGHNCLVSSAFDLCLGYMWNIIISTFVDVRRQEFYFCAWKLAWNYFKIISQDFCNSWIFFNVFNVAEIVLEEFRNSVSGWNVFVSVSDVLTCETKHWNSFKIISKRLCLTCNHGISLDDDDDDSRYLRF